MMETMEIKPLGSCSNSRKWIPTSAVKNAVIVKPFLPLKRHPQLIYHTNQYVNLYVGSEIYVFEETDDNQWCRGYYCSLPFPEQFLSSMSSMASELPDSKPCVVVFPKVFAYFDESKTVELQRFFKMPEPSDFEPLVSKDCKTPSLYATLSARDTRHVTTISPRKPIRPSFPYFRFLKRPFQDEISPVLSILCSHIFAMYTQGEFSIFYKLVSLYYEFDMIRIQLSYRLSTEEGYATKKRYMSVLFAQISKLLSSKGRTNGCWGPKNAGDTDPSGFEGIFARDVNSCELLNFEDTSLRTLVQSSAFFGLSNIFPVNDISALDFTIPRNDVYDQVGYNIIVDFGQLLNGFENRLPAYENLRAMVHLRTKKDVITDCYEVDISPGVGRLSTIIYSGFNKSFLKRNKVYLAISITKNVSIATKSIDPQKLKSSKSPFLPFDDSDENTIENVQKGVASGLIEISPVFCRYKNIPLTSMAHKFTIKLFGSYDNNRSHLNGNAFAGKDLGWGDVINKILNDSTEGIGVNRDAVSIDMMAKELEEGELNKDILINSVGPIRNIKAVLHGQTSAKFEIVYFALGKVDLLGKYSNKTNIRSISVRLSSNNPHIRFGKNPEESEKCWNFTSVQPGKLVNEYIRISGAEYMDASECIRVLVYLNGHLMAKSNIFIRQDGIFMHYNKYTKFQLLGSSGVPFIELEIKSTYIGTRFASFETVENFVAQVEEFVNDRQYNLQKMNEACESLNEESFKIIMKNFDKILDYYTQLLKKIIMHEHAVDRDQRQKILFSFSGFLEASMLGQDNCRPLLYTRFQQSLLKPNSDKSFGSTFVRFIADALADVDNHWTLYEQRMCRISLYMIMFSVVINEGLNEPWIAEVFHVFEMICDIMQKNDPSFTQYQIGLLCNMPSWLDICFTHFEPHEKLSSATRFFGACQQREDYLSERKKKFSEEDLHFSALKLSALRRLISHETFRDILFENQSSSDISLNFLANVIEWVVKTWKSKGDQEYNISLIRLANGILITLLENSKNAKLQKNIILLLPLLCEFFISMRKYCKRLSMFKTRRSFTKLFPYELPLKSIPIDSIVNDEFVVEVLLELATIIASCCKIAWNIYGDSSLFTVVLRDCSGDTEFNNDFYIKKLTGEHIITITKTIRLFFRGEFFPAKKWLGISAMLARCSLMMLIMCKDYITSSQNIIKDQEHDRSDMKLLVEYFKGVLMLANHKVASLSRLAIVSRKAVILIAGDIKKEASIVLNECWDALALGVYEQDYANDFGFGSLGKLQQDLLIQNSTLITDIFIFAFNKHIDATRISCKLIWTFALSSWRTTGSFQSVLNLFIPELYSAYHTGSFYLDEYDLERFVKCIFFTIHLFPDNVMYGPVLDFLKELLGFLYIISEVYKIPLQPEFDDDRTARHIEMFSYLLTANRPELFNKMIHDLFIHSIKKKDYVQAALGLELLAGTYIWDPNDLLPAIPYPPMPEQSSFERKEYLYKEAARNFARGLKLEKALSVYKRLMTAYDEINYDLNGLAFVHDQISSIYTELQSVDRMIPTYFKVSFMGYGFPTSLRNRAFVFEGLPFEHISSMHNRLLRIYHGSTIVQTQEEVDDLLLTPSMGKHIHVSTVEPRLSISDEYSNSNRVSTINNKIRMYIENRDPDTFNNFRRLPGSTSITDLWVEEYTYTTVSTFPTLMNRSEINQVTKRKLSPLENAIRSLHMKIQELYSLENMCYKALKEQGDYSDLFEELSRNLMGTISAPVNGGMSQYKEFLKSPTQEKFDKNELNKLVSAFDELVVVASRCLVLHEEFTPTDDGMESHKMLVELFQDNFYDEVQRMGIDIKSMNMDTLTRYISRRTSQRNLNRRQGFLWDRAGFGSHAIKNDWMEPFNRDDIIFGKYLNYDLKKPL